MVATGSEAVTLEQLKRLKDSSSGDGGAAIHVLELTSSTPSFTFEKSGIVFTRNVTDFTIVAVDSEYGVVLLGFFQKARITSKTTVANVTGGANVGRYCYSPSNTAGEIETVEYNGRTVACTPIDANSYVNVSMWIPKA